MKFSDRVGATTPRETLQVESIDRELTNLLWNVLIEHYLNYDEHKSDTYKNVYMNIWVKFFKKPSDKLPGVDSRRRDWIRDWFFNTAWHQKYNFVEFTGDSLRQRKKPKDQYLEKLINQTEGEIHKILTRNHHQEFQKAINLVLTQEKAGYRFVDGVLVPITDEIEIETIQASSILPDKYSGARQHIKNATEAFSKKPSPDYSQVIKESISGVESIARVITGNEKATLGKALNELNNIKPIHGSMKDAFHKLYGYTSDEEGLRHSMLTDETKISEADAHFMLVVCSAFINFAVAHYQTD